MQVVPCWVCMCMDAFFQRALSQPYRICANCVHLCYFRVGPLYTTFSDKVKLLGAHLHKKRMEYRDGLAAKKQYVARGPSSARQ